MFLKYRVKALFQYLATVTSILGAVSTGMVTGWSSTTLLELQKSSLFSITNDEGSWITVMPFFGTIISSTVNFIMADKIGRKNTILISTIPFFISWIMIVYSESVLVLYLGRLTAGMADGLIFTSVPIYITEIAESKRRGMLETGIPIAMALGILLINLIGSNLDVSTTALICCSLPVLTLVVFVWMPESPYYLLMKKNTKAARRSLQILRGTQDVDAELNSLRDVVDEENSNSGTFKQLFTVKSNRKALCIALMIRTIQKIAGIDAITFYGESIFKEMGSDVAPDVCIIIFSAIQLVIFIIFCSIVDRIGRKPLLVISLVGTSLMGFIEGTFFYLQSKRNVNISSYSLVAVITLFSYVFFYCLGLAAIPLIITSEIFPSNVKMFGISLMEIYYCVLTAIIGKSFQILRDSFGMHTPFYLSAVCSALSLFGIVYIIPETKGHTLADIQINLRREM